MPVGVIAIAMGKAEAKALAPACRFSETHLVNGYNKFLYKLKLVISIVLALLCVVAVVKDVLSPLPLFAGPCLPVHLSYALGCTACNDGSSCCQIVLGLPASRKALRVLGTRDQDLEVLLESKSKTTFNYVKHFGSVAHIHTYEHTHIQTWVGRCVCHTCVSSSLKGSRPQNKTCYKSSTFSSLQPPTQAQKCRKISFIIEKEENIFIMLEKILNCSKVLEKDSAVSYNIF